jgi:preprotein translocase subunit SecE
VARGRKVPRRLSFRHPSAWPFDQGWRGGRNRTIMANPFNFLQDVRAEARKVTWPTRRETLITTGVVILMVFMTALFFLSVDQMIRLVVGFILGLGR